MANRNAQNVVDSLVALCVMARPAVGQQSGAARSADASECKSTKIVLAASS